MIPLHSLPMGCVCNLLEYKSCIIHVYRRATSINYVSLLGVRVYHVFFSVYSFSLSSCLSLYLLSSHNHNNHNDILCSSPPLFISLIAQFTRVKWTVSKLKLEKMKGNSGEKESLQWCCDVNALI